MCETNNWPALRQHCAAATDTTSAACLHCGAANPKRSAICLHCRGRNEYDIPAPAPTHAVPDFDDVACKIVDDYYSASAADGDKLQEEIASELHHAYDAGQQNAAALARMLVDEQAAHERTRLLLESARQSAAAAQHARDVYFADADAAEQRLARVRELVDGAEYWLPPATFARLIAELGGE